MKISNIYIKDFKEGMNIKGFYLCKYVEKKITRLGDEYLDLVLEDKTGTIRAKIWSFINNYKVLAENGKPVAVKGDIILYNKEKEINISHINNVKNSIYKKYGYDENRLIKKIDHNIPSLLRYLNNKIKKINKEYVKELLLMIQENIDIIKRFPSNISNYNISGGLLLEITDVLKLNDLLIHNCKNLNQSIIVSGIILKKIGLIEYYKDNLEFSINENKQDINLCILSMNVINKYFNSKSSESIKFILQSIVLFDKDKKSDKYSAYVNALYELNNSCK